MPRLVKKTRKSRALSTSVPQCLSGLGVSSLNVLTGCLFECAYCRFQARKYTTPDTAFFYVDLPRQLREELASLKKRNQTPIMVLFNTASDAFWGDKRVEDIAAGCLDVLFEQGIHVCITTKGIVSDRLLDQLSSRIDLVSFNYGICSLSGSFVRLFEAGVPPLEERLAFLERLRRARIPVRARIEPLIPMENDSDKDLETLFRRLYQSGIRDVVASYLQMPAEVASRLQERLKPVHFSMLLHNYRKPDGGTARLLPEELRKKQYSQLKALGARVGIRVIVCACQNADIFSGRCYLVPSGLEAAPNRGLF